MSRCVFAQSTPGLLHSSRFSLRPRHQGPLLGLDGCLLLRIIPQHPEQSNAIPLVTFSGSTHYPSFGLLGPGLLHKVPFPASLPSVFPAPSCGHSENNNTQTNNEMGALKVCLCIFPCDLENSIYSNKVRSYRATCVWVVTAKITQNAQDVGQKPKH